MKLFALASVAVCFLSACVVVPIPIPTASRAPETVPMRYAPQGTPARQIGTLLNQERATRGLRPVSYNPQLDRIAQGHALDMQQNGFLDHRGSNGRSAHQRLQAAGYGPCVSAENLARDFTEAAHLMATWMNSPKHRANNTRPDVLEYGVGYERGGNHWVLVLASPGC